MQPKYAYPLRRHTVHVDNDTAREVGFYRKGCVGPEYSLALLCVFCPTWPELVKKY